MYRNEEHRTRLVENPRLRDLNTGEMVEVSAPESFFLDTVLLESAYYRYSGKEYRFLLSRARELGLKIA
jgi:hypothetical protein